jgi:hypothetical protein
MTTRAKELEKTAIRIDNDVNGNPRYYLPKFVWPSMTDKIRRAAGLNMYRGKKYGAGYVMQSYSLEHDIEIALRTIGAEA